MYVQVMDDPLTLLRNALSLPPGGAQISRTTLAEVLRTAEIAVRLRPYAVHRPDCGHFTKQVPYSGTMLPGGCTCGLGDVLAGRYAGEADPHSERARVERGARARG